MKTYKRGQKLIALTNDQGLESGKIYTFIGEEFFNLPYMECSSHKTKFLKVLDSSGEIHIITEKHGLFHDSWDTWSPEARAAALEARRRKARMRAKTPKEVGGIVGKKEEEPKEILAKKEEKPKETPAKKEEEPKEKFAKRKSLSRTRGIYDLDEDDVDTLQKYSDFLDENIYDFSLREEDFLPGGKYERASMEFLGLKDRKEFEEYLKEHPGRVEEFTENDEDRPTIQAIANKVDVENNMYARLKDNPLFSKLSESECRGKIRDTIHGWAQTSGDAHKESIAVQIVANKVFSIDGQLDHFPSRNEEVFKSAEQLANSEFGEMQAEFLRAQYEITQEYLKKAGIKELALFRGYKGDKEKGYNLDSGTSVNVGLQPLSSFSIDPTTAASFAKDTSPSQTPSVIAAVVKADRILSVPRTGYGCSDEREVVVLGGKIKATVYSGGYLVQDILWGGNTLSDLLDSVEILEDDDYDEDDYD